MFMCMLPYRLDSFVVDHGSFFFHNMLDVANLKHPKFTFSCDFAILPTFSQSNDSNTIAWSLASHWEALLSINEWFSQPVLNDKRLIGTHLGLIKRASIKQIVSLTIDTNLLVYVSEALGIVPLKHLPKVIYEWCIIHVVALTKYRWESVGFQSPHWRGSHELESQEEEEGWAANPSQDCVPDTGQVFKSKTDQLFFRKEKREKGP